MPCQNPWVFLSSDYWNWHLVFFSTTFINPNTCTSILLYFDGYFTCLVIYTLLMAINEFRLRGWKNTVKLCYMQAHDWPLFFSVVLYFLLSFCHLTFCKYLLSYLCPYTSDIVHLFDKNCCMPRCERDPIPVEYYRTALFSSWIMTYILF